MNKERKKYILKVIDDHVKMRNGKNGVFTDSNVKIENGEEVWGCCYDEEVSFRGRSQFVIQLKTDIVLTESEYMELRQEVMKRESKIVVKNDEQGKKRTYIGYFEKV